MSIAYPLNDEYANIYLTEQEISDLAIVLKHFLHRCNTSNIHDFNFDQQMELL